MSKEIKLIFYYPGYFSADFADYEWFIPVQAATVRTFRMHVQHVGPVSCKIKSFWLVNTNGIIPFL